MSTVPDIPMVELQEKMRREAVEQLESVASNLRDIIVHVIQVVDDLPSAERAITLARDALAGVEDAIGSIANPFIWGDEEGNDHDA